MSEAKIDIVVTGDQIRQTYDDNILGHNTLKVERDGKPIVISTVNGKVQHMNKLIVVNPSCRRYSPEIGDVVVGRVTAIDGKRWKIDLNAGQSGALLISSVNLPGGQRRRTDEDALQMRAFLSESDLISAEVQKINGDKSASIHTRSHRYGKLEFGTVVEVSASLIKRCKQHFHQLPEFGLEMIIGVNGYIWIAPMLSEEEKLRKLNEAKDDSLIEKVGGGTGTTITERTGLQTFDDSHITDDIRESMARLRNSVRLLAQAHKPIYKESILHVYDKSVTYNLSCYKMLLPQNVFFLTEHADL